MAIETKIRQYKELFFLRKRCEKILGGDTDYIVEYNSAELISINYKNTENVCISFDLVDECFYLIYTAKDIHKIICADTLLELLNKGAENPHIEGVLFLKQLARIYSLKEFLK